jgi:hypothetical protein
MTGQEALALVFVAAVVALQVHTWRKRRARAAGGASTGTCGCCGGCEAGRAARLPSCHTHLTEASGKVVLKPVAATDWPAPDPTQPETGPRPERSTPARPRSGR